MTSTATTPDTALPARDDPGAGAAEGDLRPDAAPGPEAPDGRGRPRHFWWWLGAIVGGALALRLTYVIGWRTPWEPIGDPYYYHHGANLLADGEGYVHPYQYLLFGVRMPGADHPPGYMTVLAGFSWLGLRSFFQHQVLSCLIGAAGVAAMGLAGRRIAGERVGLVVAALAAVSPNLFYFDAMVVSESMVVATTAAILIAAYRWWDRTTPAAAATFGAVIGIAALVRSEAILLGPLIALPLLWWRRRTVDDPARPARWLPQLALAGGVAALVIAPWVGYNMSRFSEPVALSAQFDQTLGTANCDTVYHGDRVGYWSLACIQETEHLVGEGDASAQGKGFREIALRYARENSDRVPYVVAGRVGRTFGLYQPQEQIFLDTQVETKEPVLGEVGLFVWYAIGVAGLVGLVGLRAAGRPIFPVVAIVGSVVVTVAAIYGNTRFRLPAELALMIPAGVSADAGLAAAGRRWRAWRARRAAAPVATTTPLAPAPDASGADGPARDGAAEEQVATDGVTGGAGAVDAPGGLGSSHGRYAGFDGVRGLAAVGVLVTHVALEVGFSASDARGHYLARLDVGVAIFFVLSGFLLYRPFVARRLDGRPRPETRSYLRNRFLRIFPAYWLAFTVLVVVLDVRGRDEVQGLWDFVVFYGLGQSYSAHTALGGLQQAWTLTNEVAFYLVLPLWAWGATWLARRLAPARAVAAEMVVLAGAAVGALAFRGWIHSVDTSDVTLGTIDPRIHWLPANFHMFVPGMALALAVEWARRRGRPFPALEAVRRHPLACWAAAGACFWAVSTQLDLGFGIGATGARLGVTKELLYVAVGFLVVLPVALAGATLPRSLRWLASRPMVALGIVSYGIYLWHEGVLDIYRDVFDIGIFTGSFPAALAVTLVGSLAAAAVSYVVVERPALALKDRGTRLFAAWRPVGLPAGATADG
jgi:peptidoglycan/LPS O-acetylase OafA/YrhL/4-amino-4-deoxy-L-arabinose transferase-like glycosyltransferase